MKVDLGRRPKGWGGQLLVAVVVGWFALLILAPTLALARAALAGGFGPFRDALLSADARRAFALTIGISAAATAVNTLFGLGLALVKAAAEAHGGTVELAAARPDGTGLAVQVDLSAARF